MTFIETQIERDASFRCTPVIEWERAFIEHMSDNEYAITDEDGFVEFSIHIERDY